jgi:hypothetical protein
MDAYGAVYQQQRFCHCMEIDNPRRSPCFNSRPKRLASAFDIDPLCHLCIHYCTSNVLTVRLSPRFLAGSTAKQQLWGVLAPNMFVKC